MHNRRRKIQFRLALRLKVARYMITLAVFSLLVLGVCVFFFIFWNPIASGLLLISDPFTRSAAQVFNNAVRSLFLLFFVLNLTFLWLTYVISVRVIGPFARINRVLEEIAEGNTPQRIGFRSSDQAQFQELVEPFNRALATIRQRKEQLEEIKKELDAYLASHEGSAAAKGEAVVLRKIKERLDKLG